MKRVGESREAHLARQAAYNALPERKVRQRTRHCSPKQRERLAAYNASPKGKAQKAANLAAPHSAYPTWTNREVRYLKRNHPGWTPARWEAQWAVQAGLCASCFCRCHLDEAPILTLGGHFSTTVMRVARVGGWCMRCATHSLGR